MLTIPFQSDAQKYRKMLGDSSVWLQVYTGLEMRTLTYSIDGDTLIGGIHYKISHYDAYFFLREDTITQQVFLKRADSLILPEKVLYDFSKKVGDTIYSYYFDYRLFQNHYCLKMIEVRDTGYIVDSIKIRPILSDSLRYFYGHYLGYDKWRTFTIIEGVGFPSGLLNPFNNLYYNIVSCKFIDGIHQYKALKGTVFDMYLDTSCYVPWRNGSISQVENNYFSIYPNPITNKLTLEGKPLQNCKAEVYDITGKLLKTIIINGNEINFNNYYNGLVLIRIFDKQGNIVGLAKGMKL